VRIGLAIPVLNAGNTVAALTKALLCQTVRPDVFLVIDSSSSDGSPETLSRAGARVHRIPREQFDHGGTRQMAVDLLGNVDIMVFLTQDAVPASPETFERLLSCFRDEETGAAFGRQLPRPGAGPIEAHARLYNYPPESKVKGYADAKTIGIKAAFISNSFAAYRRSSLESVGGFPKGVILCEDSIVAAKMLLNGLKVAYCSDAAVFHSHEYRPVEEMKRYFDTGVLHARESWIRRSFGKPEGEGLRFIRSECRYLWKENSFLLPSALFRSTLKLAGYRLGLLERALPSWLKVRLSMNKRFWQ
jgi:rhamnosyltransferase